MTQLDVASERDSGQRGLLEGRDDTLMRGDGEGAMEGSGVTDMLCVRDDADEPDGDSARDAPPVTCTDALTHTDAVSDTDALLFDDGVAWAEPYTDGEGEGDAGKGGATESSNAKPFAAVAVQDVAPLCTAFPKLALIKEDPPPPPPPKPQAPP